MMAWVKGLYLSPLALLLTILNVIGDVIGKKNSMNGT